ncbi:ParA family protein (plasmid) [Paenibacillus thiaminolyticus]|uniref:ParA family protein n=1 Tax=Paenibacillus thiaminolyticus TaxID=49283 RepID=UPI002330099C|nr:ParA family protein [Paenibacillus thiaminolyticus]WCF11392.1 ParA family protein [Paenibacillus thiaminolyticus]
MAKIIAVGITKGGSGKSTTSSILSYMLSQKKKVLAVDTDGQGNLTQLLTGVDDIFEFQESTVYDSILAEDATNYIFKITDNLHILPGDENINTLGPYFHVELGQQERLYQFSLRNALEKVAHMYDYIIIDCPPALGEICICSLTAADYVIIPFETSKFCHSSLLSYLKTIEAVTKSLNNDLKIAGILRSMIDNRRKDNKYYSDLVGSEFPELVFKTIIKRTADVGRLPAFGFIENPDVKIIMKQYEPWFKELKKIVK